MHIYNIVFVMTKDFQESTSRGGCRHLPNIYDGGFFTKTLQHTQWAFICSKLTIEVLEIGVKYVQS